MTNHAELSRDLALALGWPKTYIEHDVCRVGEPLMPELGPKVAHIMNWRKFDYRDPTVCLPLIEWLMREHRMCVEYEAKMFWVTPRLPLANTVVGSAHSDTLPEAVARAVIAVKGSK